MGITWSNIATSLRDRFIAGPLDQTTDRFILPCGQRPIGTTGQALPASRAVFIYMGRATRAWTPAAVAFLCRTAPTGTGQYELWMGTSPNPPIRSTTQTLTRIWSGLSTTIPATTAVTRFTTALPQIAAGAYVWLGARSVAWTTQPSIEASSYGVQSGSVFYWVGATDLTLGGGATIASGSLTIPPVTDLTPTLRLEV